MPAGGCEGSHADPPEYCFIGVYGSEPEIAVLLKEMLNREIHPLIPERGSVGEADIVNLSFLGLALMGEGLVELQGKGDKSKGCF